MFKSLSRSTLFGILLPFALLTTFNANAEPMNFSYTFEANFLPEPPHTWGSGATLTGEIDGIIDPLDPDRVIINSFGQVVLSRPGLPVFEYDAIDASEFRGDPPEATPVMSFSGTILNFVSCPGGFTDDRFPAGVPDGVLDDCSFGTAPGGGFLLVSVIEFATAADGTSDEVCIDPPTPENPRAQRRADGCRVADIPILTENWGLVRLPDSADVDPSAVIGSGSTIKENIVIEEGAVLGKNVTLNKDAVIGANSMIGHDTIIKKGVYVCSGITIGSVVTIGKNRLVDTNVPDGIVWNGTKDLPDPADCP